MNEPAWTAAILPHKGVSPLSFFVYSLNSSGDAISSRLNIGNDWGKCREAIVNLNSIPNPNGTPFPILETYGDESDVVITVILCDLIKDERFERSAALVQREPAANEVIPEQVRRRYVSLDEDKPIWRNERFSIKIEEFFVRSRNPNLQIVCGNKIEFKSFRQLRGPFDSSTPNALNSSSLNNR